MINFIKRFFRARGSIRFKILYGLDYWKDIEKDKFFVTEKIEGGEWATITRAGYVHKSK